MLRQLSNDWSILWGLGELTPILSPQILGVQVSRQVSIWRRNSIMFMIHLDVDLIDFENFPIAENTRRKIGLTFEQVMTAFEALLQAPIGTGGRSPRSIRSTARRTGRRFVTLPPLWRLR
jgi:hypothetical protein